MELSGIYRNVMLVFIQTTIEARITEFNRVLGK